MSWLPEPCAIPLRPMERGIFAIVDAADFERLADLPWYALASKRTSYAAAKIEGRMVYMHRLVLAPAASENTDHINGDGLDNRRANLRLATDAQNMANRRKALGPASSQYKGVSHRPGVRRPWRAEIRTTVLGYFHTEEEAAMAYDDAAREAFGEYARPNFVTEDAGGAA